MTRDSAIHVAVALLLQAVVVALFWLPFGPLAGAWAGACVGAATFLSREIAQAPHKISRAVNWPEAWWPSLVCGAAAVAATVVIKGFRT